LVLIDTSAWIFALRKKPLLSLKDRVDYLLGIDIVFTFGMIRLEILGGVKTKGEFDCLKKRLEALNEIPADTELWERASKLAFDLKRKGLTIPYTDILIASAAIRSKAILMHADSHFDIIVSHTELKVESYVSQIKKGF